MKKGGYLIIYYEFIIRSIYNKTGILATRIKQCFFIIAHNKTLKKKNCKKGKKRKQRYFVFE